MNAITLHGPLSARKRGQPTNRVKAAAPAWPAGQAQREFDLCSALDRFEEILPAVAQAMDGALQVIRLPADASVQEIRAA